MNKTSAFLLLSLSTLCLSGCTEKKQYEQAVLEQMQNEPDIKDYHLDPVRMAECVVQTSSRKMPGLFPGDPDRMKAYLAYIKLLTLNKSQNPQQVMAELRTAFGSAQGVADARSNYAESLVECQTDFITSTEEKFEAAPASEAVPATPPVTVSESPAAAPAAEAVPAATPAGAAPAL